MRVKEKMERKERMKEKEDRHGKGGDREKVRKHR